MSKIDFDAEPTHDAWDALVLFEPELAADLMARVMVGSLLFDRVRFDWHRAVRLDALNIASREGDPLTLVFGGDYNAAFSKLTRPLGHAGPMMTSAVGLCLTYHEQGGGCGKPGCTSCGGTPSTATEDQVVARFAALTAAWVRMVKLRLEDERGAS